MRHRDSHLRRHETAGQGGVHVTDDQQQIRARLQYHGFEPRENRRRLLRVRAAADLQVEVGPGNAQLLEEQTGHALVVVLSRVH
jgi:hypothetical protein